MKKLLIAMFGAALVLGACGAADEPAPAEETPPADEAPAGDETAAGLEYDAALADAAYQQSCAGCHGGNLEGAGAYPNSIAGMSYAEVLAAIEAGPGMMPADLVTGEEAENLAAWIADQ